MYSGSTVDARWLQVPSAGMKTLLRTTTTGSASRQREHHRGHGKRRGSRETAGEALVAAQRMRRRYS